MDRRLMKRKSIRDQDEPDNKKTRGEDKEEQKDVEMKTPTESASTSSGTATPTNQSQEDIVMATPKKVEEQGGGVPERNFFPRVLPENTSASSSSSTPKKSANRPPRTETPTNKTQQDIEMKSANRTPRTGTPSNKAQRDIVMATPKKVQELVGRVPESNFSPEVQPDASASSRFSTPKRQASQAPPPLRTQSSKTHTFREGMPCRGESSGAPIPVRPVPWRMQQPNLYSSSSSETNNSSSTPELTPMNSRELSNTFMEDFSNLGESDDAPTEEEDEEPKDEEAAGPSNSNKK